MLYRALNTGASGMTANIFNLDVIANNLANAGTVGFKRSRCNFEDLYYQYYKMPGVQDSQGQYIPIGIAAGIGTRVAGTEQDFTQGSVVMTGKPLDVAILGDGFFIVQDTLAPNGFLYTRNGQFTQSATGQLMIASADRGRFLDPPINIPQNATDITITQDGYVNYMQPGSTQPTQAGIIQLAKFFNNEGLVQYGESFYMPSPSSGVPTPAQPSTLGLGMLQQNSLEQSNTEPVKELVDLIKTQRNVELNSQVVQACDQLLQLTSNLRRF